MISDIILHIGMQKTGSTSIQRSFRDYDDGDLIYAPFDGTNHSGPAQILFMDWDFQTPDQRIRGYGEPEYRREHDAVRARLVDALARDRVRMLVSAEGAMEFSADEHRRLLSFFRDRGARVRPMAYVRDPVSYVSSFFQQRIKHGLNRFHLPLPAYRRRFGRVIGVYGADDTDLVRFDPKGFPGGNVINDFCARVGARPDLLLNETGANESMCAYAAGALFLWNRDGTATGDPRTVRKARAPLVRLLIQMSASGADMPGSRGGAPAAAERGMRKFRFSDAFVRDRLDFDDIAWMEDVLGTGLMDAPVDAAADTGIRSQDDLIAIGQAARAWLDPALRKRGLRARDATTVAAMDALFGFFLDRNRRAAERTTPAG